jgi:RHS repeat-associated protein
MPSRWGEADEGERFWGPSTTGGRIERRQLSSRRRRWVAVGVAVALVGVGMVTVAPKILGHSPRKLANLPGLTSANRHASVTPSTGEPTNLSGSHPDFSHPPPRNGDVAALNAAAAKARAKAGGGFEPKRSVVIARDATTDTYRNPDGTYTKQTHLVPVNYQDSSGQWRPIDTSLVRTSNGGLGTKASPLTVRFAASTTGATSAARRRGRRGLNAQLVDAADVVTVSAGDWSVGFSLEGAQPAQVTAVTPSLPSPPADPRPAGPVPLAPGPPQTPPSGAPKLPGKVTTLPGKLDDQIASYGQVLPGVTLNYAAGPQQLKEDIELAAAPSTPPVFRFPLDLNGVTPRTALDGTIQFVDSSGTVQASIGQGVMADSAPANRGPNPGAVAITLENSDQGYTLVVTPDPAWLADPSRVYPVHIDPSVYAGWQTPSYDGVAVSVSPNTPCSGACQYCCYGEVYLDSVGLGWYYEYFYANTYETFNLDLGSLPNPNIHVLSASWNAWFTTGGNSYPVYMVPGQGPWNASTVTWANQPYYNWNSGYAALTGISTAGATSVPVTGWVQDWVNGSLPNYGLVFDSPSSWVRFLAADSTVPYEEPVLAITYNTIPPPSPLVGPGTRSPSAPTVANTTTPTLTSQAVTDSDGDTVKYQYVVTTNPDAETGQVLNSGWVSSPSYAVPPGVLQDGVTYYWTAYTWDGTDQNGGPTTSAGKLAFTVNLGLGQQPTHPTDTVGPASVDLTNGNLSLSTSSPSFPAVGGTIGVGFTYNSEEPSTAGLRGYYYNESSDSSFPNANPTAEQPFLVRTDPQINFVWNGGPPVPNGPSSKFMVRWVGYVNVGAGNWQFGTTQSDGAQIWINQSTPSGSNTYLNQWSDQSFPTSPTFGGTVGLSSGWVPIQIDYYQDANSQSGITLYARQQGDTSNGVIVPSSDLSTLAPTLPPGWQMSASQGATVGGYTSALVSSNQVVLYDATGMTHTYTAGNANGSGDGFTPPAGEDSTLIRNPDGSLTLHDPGGTDYEFDATGHLTSVTTAGPDDLNPAAPTYTYTTSSGGPPLLSAIGDPVSGKTLKLYYGGNSACPANPPSNLASAPAGMLCKLDYSAFGDGSTNVWYVANSAVGPLLGRVENAPGEALTDFAYSGTQLTAIRDPLANDAIVAGKAANDGTSQTLIAYDTQNRVSSVQSPVPQPGASRPEDTYTYLPGNNPPQTDISIAGLTGERKVTYLYNQSGPATSTVTDTDPTGKTTTETWDDRNMPLAKTDPTGLVATIGYDAQGRPNTETGPAASGASTPSSSTTYDGGLQGLQAAYYNDQNLTGPTVAHTVGIGDPTGAVNLTGALPSGVPTNAWSMVLTGEIQLAATGNYTFQATAADGVNLYVDDVPYLNAWTNGQKTPTSNPFDNTTPNSWHRIRIEYYDNTSTPQLSLQWTPPGGTLTAVPGNVLIPRLDLVTSTVDANGTTTQTNYQNPALRLPTSTVVDPGGLNLTTSTAYEAPGSGYLRPVSQTPPAGNQTTDTYYGAQQQVANPCPSGGSANQDGELESTTGPSPDGTSPGRVATYIYDDAGRIVASRIGNDSWSCTTYESRGRPSTETTPAYEGSPARTVTYNYAVNSNPLATSVSDSSGTITTMTDLLGRAVSYTDVLGDTTLTSYDQAGRVTQSTGPLGTEQTSYDDAGRPTSVTLNNTGLATATYDAVGRLSTVSYPQAANGGNGTSLAPIGYLNGNVTNLTWDNPNGQPITSDAVTRAASGRVTNEAIDGVDATPSGPDFTYDNAGRLTSANLPGANTIAYNYGATSSCGAGSLATAGNNDNRTSETETQTGQPVSSNAYCYNGADQLTSTTTPGLGAITYDSHGNTTTLGAQTMTYDGADRQMSLTANGQTVTYTRDATDRIVARTQQGPALIAAHGTATASTDGTTTNVTVNRPTGTQPGDQLIAQLAVTGGSNVTITPPMGWTVISEQSNTTAVHGALYRYTATGTDPANWTWTLSAGEPTAAAITAYSNVDPNNPIDTSANAAATNATTHPAPSLTTSGTDDLLVTAYALSPSSTVAAPPGETQRVNQTSPGATPVTAEQSDTVLGVPGTTATPAVTSSVSTNSVEIAVTLRSVTVNQTVHYGYIGSDDSPDFTLDTNNQVLSRTYPLPGGAVLTRSGSGANQSDVWSYPNVHGDVAATADANGVKQGPTYTYDPFGQALNGEPNNSNGALDDGWLGQDQRGVEDAPGLTPIIEMGAREYSPTLGRFLQVDPEPKGSCNPYDYACADPINRSDLNGTSINLGSIFGGVAAAVIADSSAVVSDVSYQVQHYIEPAAEARAAAEVRAYLIARANVARYLEAVARQQVATFLIAAAARAPPLAFSISGNIQSQPKAPPPISMMTPPNSEEIAGANIPFDRVGGDLGTCGAGAISFGIIGDMIAGTPGAIVLGIIGCGAGFAYSEAGSPWGPSLP